MTIALLDGFQYAEPGGIEVKEGHGDTDERDQFANIAGKLAKPGLRFVFANDLIHIFGGFLVAKRINGGRVNRFVFFRCQNKISTLVAYFTI